MMELFTILLLIGLVVCAVSASLAKNLLNTLLIFMAFSLMMSMIWLLLQAPDLAITEAAVGAGVSVGASVSAAGGPLSAVGSTRPPPGRAGGFSQII